MHLFILEGLMTSNHAHFGLQLDPGAGYLDPFGMAWGSMCEVKACTACTDRLRDSPSLEHTKVSFSGASMSVKVELQNACRSVWRSWFLINLYRPAVLPQGFLDTSVFEAFDLKTVTKICNDNDIRYHCLDGTAATITLAAQQQH